MRQREEDEAAAAEGRPPVRTGRPLPRGEYEKIPLLEADEPDPSIQIEQHPG